MSITEKATKYKTLEIDSYVGLLKGNKLKLFTWKQSNSYNSFIFQEDHQEPNRMLVRIKLFFVLKSDYYMLHMFGERMRAHNGIQYRLKDPKKFFISTSLSIAFQARVVVWWAAGVKVYKLITQTFADSSEYQTLAKVNGGDDFTSCLNPL